MKVKSYYLVPTETRAGLTSISLGLVRALDREGLPVTFFKPICQPTSPDADQEGPDRSTHFLKATGHFDPPEPIPFDRVQQALETGNKDTILEEVVENFEKAANAGKYESCIVVVEGLVPTQDQPELEMLNKAIISALDSDVIAVATGSTVQGVDDYAERLNVSLHRTISKYDGASFVGCIINKLNKPCKGIYLATSKSYVMPEPTTEEEIASKCKIFSERPNFHLLGAIKWDRSLMRVRTSDMAKHLGAKVLFEGEIERRRVDDVTSVARHVAKMVDRLRPHTLIVTPGDREDILLAACLAELNGVKLAGVVLTCGELPPKTIVNLCDKVLKQTGLPVLSFDGDSYVAAATAVSIEREVPIDDTERIENVMNKIASKINVQALRDGLNGAGKQTRLSPPAFRHHLVVQARASDKRIVLPEGEDPRILRAAIKCQQRGIARCVLLGDPAQIKLLAEAQGVEIPSQLEIIHPTAEMREKYVMPMVNRRKHKGLDEYSARAQLEDITVLATMMLAEGEVDGLVSGAIHTTANTIRPALQIVKTRPDADIVSSVFFMCLPDQVVLYGDCAINPYPNAQQLSSIAIESAHTAKAFGIEPRVAMISYSTGTSGKGHDVDKVREATNLVKQKCPDLLIDGPLQFDAATVESVAKSKAPNSPVAGRATVLVFPDLNTGNTTYKAVQRTAKVVCVGPLLQGLRRPVNDLSRGALVDDIIYTIALTSIQAEQTEQMRRHTACRQLSL